MPQMASLSEQESALIRRVRAPGMINKYLQRFCAAEGMSKVGVKADLQLRIIERIKYMVRTQDVARFQRLKIMIENPTMSINSDAGFIPHGTNGTNGLVGTGPRISQPSNSHPAGQPNGNVNHPVRGSVHNELNFNPSPFYYFQTQLGDTKTLEVMANHRHSVTKPLKPSDYPTLERCNSDPSFRVMVFCASENHGRPDISFPHQSELKVNGGDIRANLRGLKNKPGSTRPVDITKELRLKSSNYINNIEFTYALTSKKFYLAIWLVKTVPVSELVKRLDTGRRITKASILNDMASKARDTDIVATASVLSLKCPLSTLRIDLPCRSISCRHNQCFDATSYLQLQEQGPTWLCPICNNPAPFESLAVDEYVKDILNRTPRSSEQVTVQPNGEWEEYRRPEPTSRHNGVSQSDDDDDDLIEITNTSGNVRTSTPRTPAPTGVPAPGSSSTIASALNPLPLPLNGQSGLTVSPKTPPPSIGAKRPVAFIDLTSSGDEEEDTVSRVPKRQLTSSHANHTNYTSNPDQPFHISTNSTTHPSSDIYASRPSFSPFSVSYNVNSNSNSGANSYMH